MNWKYYYSLHAGTGETFSRKPANPEACGELPSAGSNET